MVSIASNGRGPMTFDTFPKVQVAREYYSICYYWYFYIGESDSAFLRENEVMTEDNPPRPHHFVLIDEG